MSWICRIQIGHLGSPFLLSPSGVTKDNLLSTCGSYHGLFDLRHVVEIQMGNIIKNVFFFFPPMGSISFSCVCSAIFLQQKRKITVPTIKLQRK